LVFVRKALSLSPILALEYVAFLFFKGLQDTANVETAIFGSSLVV
jgi:hypothetical protein